MMVRGVRGATTVEANTSEAIISATEELVSRMIEANHLVPDDVASVMVTVTSDLNADFPARVIRGRAGWELVPVMCALEMPVPGSLPRCIRVLMHVNTVKSQSEIHHVYLRGATVLRPDLVNKI
ncbi:chorismate mutase [Collibacillus ludicampi]|jgi:chorismate mutase|uniref:chorismate mutase n=1 Tax=Collibacillus ludicampi TaxID=2771369 RepID=A0AAV4LLX1_9BACL|nr:chorismate mutase [Collibacillus ludicampi]GIM48177.1 chorismate mutase [Collibacillus ludicampi]